MDNPKKTTNVASADALTIEQASTSLNFLLDEMAKVIVGQIEMNRSLVVGLLTGGHILLEGLPGLAKTLAVKTLAAALDVKFQRVQFTPDLLPSDLIGTMVYHEATQSFTPRKGPLFSNIVLADEINRAPAKVQSALLEAMAEKQITLGDTTYPLPEPFLVLATQNPIEQEGTYPLPEAQLDRFLFKIRVTYPTREQERAILERMGGAAPPATPVVMPGSKLLAIRELLNQVYVDERIKDYVLAIVLSTRTDQEMLPKEADSKKIQQIRQSILIGASPRATLFLTKAAKAIALVEGRNYVIPDDVKAVAHEVLRHRLILTFDAEARNLNTDSIIDSLLESVYVP